MLAPDFVSVKFYLHNRNNIYSSHRGVDISIANWPIYVCVYIWHKYDFSSNKYTLSSISNATAIFYSIFYLNLMYCVIWFCLVIDKFSFCLVKLKFWIQMEFLNAQILQLFRNLLSWLLGSCRLDYANTKIFQYICIHSVYWFFFLLLFFSFVCSIYFICVSIFRSYTDDDAIHVEHAHSFRGIYHLVVFRFNSKEMKERERKKRSFKT